MDPRSAVGLAVVAVATVLVIGAHRRLGAGAERSALVGILMAALLLNAFTASDPFLHDWDEVYHALVAKHLSVHPGVPTLYEDAILPYDYRNWLANHVWLHKEPLGLWTMAAAIRVLGTHEFVIRIPSVLLSTFAVALTFLIGRAVGGPRVGLIAATLHAIHGLLLELAAGRVPTDHVDAQFVAIVEFGAWMALRARRWAWAPAALAVGAIAGLAALTKSVTSLLVLLLWGVVALDGTRRSGVRVAAGIAVGIAAAMAVYWPWHAYIQLTFPAEAAWESEYNVRHLWEALEGHTGGWSFHLARIPRYFGELSVLSLAWFLLRLRGGPQLAERRFVALWWAIPYAFFTVVPTKMPGYVLVAAPALFIIIGMHWVALREFARTAAGARRWLAWAAVVLLLALPVRFSLERMKPLSSPPWDRSDARAMTQLGERFADAKTVVFGAPAPLDLMFYSDVISYPQIPTRDEVERAVQRGYRVAVLGGESLPEWIREDSRIVRVAR